MAEYYARRAGEFELVYQKPEREAELLKLRQLVEQSFADKRVLEVASGTGYWTSILARSAASVLAVDINEEVLEIARSKQLDSSKVQFRIGDVYELDPGTLGAFDAAFIGFWWSHVPKERLTHFLSRLQSCLDPGAFVMSIDNSFHASSSTPISRSDDFGNHYQLRTLQDGSCFEVIKNFPSESELRASVEPIACNVEVMFMQYYWVMNFFTVSPRKE